MEHPLGRAFCRSGPEPGHGSDSILQRAGQLTLSWGEIPQDPHALLPALHGQCRIRPAPPSLASKSKQVSSPSLPSMAPVSCWLTRPSRCRRRGRGVPPLLRAPIPVVPAAGCKATCAVPCQSPEVTARSGASQMSPSAWPQLFPPTARTAPASLCPRPRALAPGCWVRLSPPRPRKGENPAAGENMIKRGDNSSGGHRPAC